MSRCRNLNVSEYVFRGHSQSLATPEARVTDNSELPSADAEN